MAQKRILWRNNDRFRYFLFINFNLKKVVDKSIIFFYFFENSIDNQYQLDL